MMEPAEPLTTRRAETFMPPPGRLQTTRLIISLAWCPAPEVKYTVTLASYSFKLLALSIGVFRINLATFVRRDSLIA